MKLMFVIMSVLLALFALTDAARPKQCDLPLEAGGCQQFVKSFYFDPKSNACKSFEYGGCGGNGNRFDSQALCEKECKK